MTHREQREYLIRSISGDMPNMKGLQVPEDEEQQKLVLRALMNIRMPMPVPDEVLAVQDEYLQEETRLKGITDTADLEPVHPGSSLYLWKGDITALKCGAIVNAANSGMLGCFQPLHGCIDNCIHTYAGMQLRLECARIMKGQGTEEPVGRAKITGAYNLPCDYVIHTVGPMVHGALTGKERKELASCYRSCLDTAAENGVGSIAFCCISTGVFAFPPKEAARIAVHTVQEHLKSESMDMKVVFNVFSQRDYAIYEDLLKD
ncbi:MAG: protein-ADP-ribose hydrolase [Clostridia bacterium]|nr:protein-ADP-ribose hydrolase [Clostridia bacterium]